MASNLVKSKENVELKEVLKTYTKHWKWFFLSVVIATILAFIYIRYSVPEYAAAAKIQILDDKNSTPEFGVFQDLDILTGGANKVEDEIEIINSRSNFIEVVEKLGINLKIIALGKIVNSEIYTNPPLKINFISADSIIHNASAAFYVNISSNTTFEFSEEIEGEVTSEEVMAFGKNLKTNIGDIVITPNNATFERYKGRKLKVVISPVALVAERYQKKMVISQADEYSNILNINLNDPIPQKARDIINTLIDIYNKNAIDDRRTIANKTSNFINDRITDIYSSLSTVDQSAEEFKTGRGLTDIASQANLNLNIGAATQQELQNTATQLNIASSMKDLVDSQEGFEVLPSNIGLSDGSIVNTTAKYNELVLERKRLLKSSNEKNPIIVNLDQQLEGLKRSMKSSLNSMTNNLGLQVNNLSSQQSQLNSRIYSAPRNERALRDITRQQQTTEALYLYLLQKREESQIAFASSTPKSKIVDRAYNTSLLPVTPKVPLIYLASLLLGLLIPFSVIYGHDLLDNKVHNKVDLEKIVHDIPVLAEIPKLSKKESRLVHKDDRSVLAESLRILRTNLDYLIKSKNRIARNNIIFITSSVPGEGKTFISSNLAMIFANTNKKVLLMGADIRNPKLYTFFLNPEIDKLSKSKTKKDVGLTEYLYDNTITTREIINPMLVHTNTIDVIYSGKIPPNPSELLMSERMKTLFLDVSEMYDYVIVDTAPLMVVTDTLLISEYADHILYVTKAGFTEKKVLEFPVKLNEEGKLKGLSFIVNNVKDSNLGYGGDYGYGYGKAEKKWWQF